MDSQQFDAFQRELYRKSMDTLLVYNPTEEDYVCVWDKYRHVIPAKSKDMGFGPGRMQLVRYLADKYMKEMKDKLITNQADLLLKKTKESRQSRGISMDPFEVNSEINYTAPRTNNEVEIEKCYGTLYCGLVREFGLYDLPEQELTKEMDMRSPEEKAMEKITTKSKEMPQAQNSVSDEPDDVTTSPVVKDMTTGSVKLPPKPIVLPSTGPRLSGGKL